MKQVVKNYSFDKTTKTVTFTDFSSISLERVYLVTNVTTGTVIFQFNNTSLGGSVSGNVLTLTYNTASMSNTDRLQIIYDATTGDPTYDPINSAFVIGNAASGAADSGNPVKTGLVYHASPITVSDGQRVDAQADANGAQLVNVKPLSQGIDSINTYTHGTAYVSITASALVLTGAGKLAGIWVSSASNTPTIKVWDNTSASGTTIIDTFTPTATNMYTFPFARCLTGLYVSLGGTVTCTIFFDATTG